MSRWAFAAAACVLMLGGCLPVYEVRVVNATHRPVTVELMSSPRSGTSDNATNRLFAVDVPHDGVLHTYAHGDSVRRAMEMRVCAAKADKPLVVKMPASGTLVGRIVESEQTGGLEFTRDRSAKDREPGDGKGTAPRETDQAHEFSPTNGSPMDR